MARPGLHGLSPTVKIPQGVDRIEGLRAAAAAALKALADAGRSTVLFEDPFPEEEEPADLEPHDCGNQQPNSATVTAKVTPGSAKVAGSPKASADNPLAAFLGSYSDDVSAGSEEAHEVPGPAQGVKQLHQQGAAGTGTQMDDELSKFMQELESSGLLDDSDAADTGAAEGAASSHSQTVGPHSVSKMPAAVNTNSHSSIAAVVEPAAAAATTSSSAAASDQEQAGPSEQRTLGMLAAAPDWYKVLDTGSGREYFWNVASNEVLWEPPEGIDATALLPVAPQEAAEPAAGADKQAGGDLVSASSAEATAAAEKSGTEAGPSGSAAGAAQSGLQQIADSQDQQQGQQALHSPKMKGTMAQQPAAISPQQQQPPSTSSPGKDHAGKGAGQADSTLQKPQQDIHPVFSTLLAELQAVPEVQQQLQQVPAAVKLLLQLQVLQQQWSVFAAQQAAAAGRGQQSSTRPGFSWHDYEQYTMQQLQKAAQQLQPTLRAVQQPQQQASHHAGSPVTGLSGMQDSDAPPSKHVSQQQQQQPPGPDEAEEGEVGPSSSSPPDSDEGEDMDVEHSPVKTPAAASSGGSKQHKQQQQQPLQQTAVATTAERAAGYPEVPPAGGLYASTSHMPMWARPSYHYSFAGHDPALAAGYHATYPMGYDMPSYSAHYGYGSYTHGYGAAIPSTQEAAAAAAAATGVAAATDSSIPPLPADEPPPLPNEAPPPLPAAGGGVLQAGGSSDAGAVPAAKRQRIVAAAAVRKPAVAAPVVGEDYGNRAACTDASALAAEASGSSKDGRKRVRDQRVSASSSSAAAAAATGPAAMGSKVKAGKVNALLNKWASVRQQQQEEEEQQQRLLEQESDPEWLEAKRQRELEQWSKQQMAAGAEDNPNFTPVMGDWRAKLGLSDGGAAAAAAGGGGTTETPEERAARKAAKKAAKAAKKAAAAAAGAGGAAASDGAGGSNSSASAWPTSMKTKPDLAALSVGLPAGWVAMYDLDQKTGVYSIYYGNPDTKETSWERP